MFRASTLLSIHKMIENFMHEKLRNMTILKNINVHRYIRTNYYSLEKFKEENRKKLSYYELFGRQLRCIPKFGEKLTMSILTLWPTPYKFHEAMNTLTLSDINFKLAINKIKMPKEVSFKKFNSFRCTLCAKNYLHKVPPCTRKFTLIVIMSHSNFIWH